MHIDADVLCRLRTACSVLLSPCPLSGRGSSVAGEWGVGLELTAAGGMKAGSSRKLAEEVCSGIALFKFITTGTGTKSVLGSESIYSSLV